MICTFLVRLFFRCFFVHNISLRFVVTRFSNAIFGCHYHYSSCQALALSTIILMHFGCFHIFNTSYRCHYRFVCSNHVNTFIHPHFDLCFAEKLEPNPFRMNHLQMHKNWKCYTAIEEKKHDYRKEMKHTLILFSLPSNSN